MLRAIFWGQKNVLNAKILNIWIRVVTLAEFVVKTASNAASMTRHVQFVIVIRLNGWGNVFAAMGFMHIKINAYHVRLVVQNVRLIYALNVILGSLSLPQNVFNVNQMNTLVTTPACFAVLIV